MDLDPSSDAFFGPPPSGKGPRPHLRFYTEPKQLSGPSAEEGRPIFKDVDYVVITNPGSRDEFVTEAKEKADLANDQAVAFAKLAAMTDQIGYPNKWRTYTFKIGAADGLTFQQVAAQQTGMTEDEYLAWRETASRPGRDKITLAAVNLNGLADSARRATERGSNSGQGTRNRSRHHQLRHGDCLKRRAKNYRER